MDATDRLLLRELQAGLPVEPRPFATVAAKLGLDEAEVIGRLRRMCEDGRLSRFGPMFDAGRLGGAVTLCAMAVPEERFEEVAAIVNGFPEVAHNYARTGRFNMWFVLAVLDPAEIPETIARIEEATGLPVLNLPKLEEYFLDLRLEP